MIVYAFFLTFLVGGFTITPTFIWVFLKLEERAQNKAIAMAIHPSNQEPVPTPGPILS